MVLWKYSKHRTKNTWTHAMKSNNDKVKRDKLIASKEFDDIIWAREYEKYLKKCKNKNYITKIMWINLEVGG